MILEYTHTEFRGSILGADSTEYYLLRKYPQTYIFICTHIIIYFTCVCVCPSPKKCVLLSSSSNCYGTHTASWPMGLKHHTVQSPSTSIRREYVSIVVGFPFVHLFCILSTILTHTVQKKCMQEIVLDM